MSTRTPEELQEILRRHKAWLNCEEEGQCADLSGADLSWANLSRANLSRADLSWADLIVQTQGNDLGGLMLLGVEAHAHFYKTNEEARVFLQSVIDNANATEVQ